MSILESAGANIDRTVMSHLDRNLQDEAKLLEFAKLGCIMEYDLFGMECSHYQVSYNFTQIEIMYTVHVLQWNLSIVDTLGTA